LDQTKPSLIVCALAAASCFDYHITLALEMMVYVTINVFGLKIIKLPNQAKCAMPFEISSNSLLVNDNIPFFFSKVHENRD